MSISESREKVVSNIVQKLEQLKPSVSSSIMCIQQQCDLIKKETILYPPDDLVKNTEKHLRDSKILYRKILLVIKSVEDKGIDNFTDDDYNSLINNMSEIRNLLTNIHDEWQNLRYEIESWQKDVQFIHDLACKISGQNECENSNEEDIHYEEDLDLNDEENDDEEGELGLEC